MGLTGKCLESFKKWYRNPLGTDEPRWTDWNGFDLYNFGNFQNLDPSMQYGVLVDFFDSVGIYCDIGMHYCIVNHNELNRKFHYQIALKPIADDIFSFSIYDARTEARTAAIKQANEIFNNR